MGLIQTELTEDQKKERTRAATITSIIEDGETTGYVLVTMNEEESEDG